jgi:hypothetical protein
LQEKNGDLLKFINRHVLSPHLALPLSIEDVIDTSTIVASPLMTAAAKMPLPIATTTIDRHCCTTAVGSVPQPHLTTTDTLALIFLFAKLVGAIMICCVALWRHLIAPPDMNSFIKKYIFMHPVTY